MGGQEGRTDIKEECIKSLSRPEKCLSGAPPLSLPNVLCYFCPHQHRNSVRTVAVQNDLVYRNRHQRPT